jgi:CRISPR type I-E-associated protein CasB/Cse2
MLNNPFIKFLCKQANPENPKGRGILAHLRRGLGKPPGHAPEMFPYVVPFLSRSIEPAEEDAYYLVASLFAHYPDHRDKIESMGDTFKRIAGKSSDSKGPEQRFVSMLNAHKDDLPKHLRHAVSLAKSYDAGVNYEKLLFDIIHWERESRDIQKKWARHFWSDKKVKTDDSISPDEENETEEE